MMDMGDMGEMMGEEPKSSPGMGPMGSADEPFEPADEFEREAADFLDESMPMASRMMALKEAIKLCMDQEKSGGYEKPGAAPAEGLALVFGDKEKKG